ncbi:histidine kinase [Aquimarina gracilis]|uniref:Histidine kinase n=1 Tax=Aquimarina gracilis TaxID=874422 RepID=A0ABU5ZQ21_9FLAO|nr:histidine kinase [Aquimarina gracilis]MEB3344173.1 histidine kinase [Aquimarina gracilis]
MKKHFIVIFVGFFLGILSYSFVGYSLEKENAKLLLGSGCLGIAIAYTVSMFNEMLNNYISWKKYTGLRLLGGILSNTIVAFLITYGVLYGFSFIENQETAFTDEYNEILLKLAILLFFVSLIYNIVYFAIHSYYQYAKGQIMRLQAERKQTELQLTALKLQLSPHFLFNSMNTISSLIYSDIKKAELFIRELAKSYQYTLTKYEDKWLSVEEELQFVNSYYFLLRTRFNDRIRLKVLLPDSVLKTRIPPLALQMLIENTVKHNQLTDSQIVEIVITSDRNYIHVSNNKTALPKRVDSFKIGLSNIRSRYELLFDKTIQIVDDDSFTVKLPIIR